jgi:hypothetical protein
MAGMARAVDIRSANPPVSARARVPSCVTVLQPPFNSAPFRNLRIVAPCVAREPHRAGGSASAPFAHEGPLAEQRWRDVYDIKSTTFRAPSVRVKKATLGSSLGFNSCCKTKRLIS